jgi:hypothetical protein
LWIIDAFDPSPHSGGLGFCVRTDWRSPFDQAQASVWDHIDRLKSSRINDLVVGQPEGEDLDPLAGLVSDGLFDAVGRKNLSCSSPVNMV